MKYLPEPDMAFLPATASFPQSTTRSKEPVRAGTTPASRANAPAWAKQQVSWPFLAAVPLTARTVQQGTASFSA